MKTKGLKLLAVILVFCLTVGMLGQKVNAKGVTVLLGDRLTMGSKSYVELEEIKVTYSLLWIMKNEYSLSVKIENKSDDVIKNWAAVIPIKGKVLSIIGADIIESDEDSIKVKHGVLNSVIFPNQSVMFTINVLGQLEVMPTQFSLIKGYEAFVEGRMLLNIRLLRL